MYATSMGDQHHQNLVLCATAKKGLEKCGTEPIKMYEKAAICVGYPMRPRTSTSGIYYITSVYWCVMRSEELQPFLQPNAGPSTLNSQHERVRSRVSFVVVIA